MPGAYSLPARLSLTLSLDWSMSENRAGTQELRLSDSRGRQLHARREEEQLQLSFQGREGELIGRALVSRGALLRGEQAESREGGSARLQLQDASSSLTLLARGGQPLIRLELGEEESEQMRGLLAGE